MTIDQGDEEAVEGPLRLVRAALAWKAFLTESSMLSIVYPHSTGGGTLTDVVVSEGWDVVAVTLFRRAMIGTYPDGSVSGEPMDLRHSCVAVAIDGPSGDRKVIDGSTGEPGEPFAADSDLWQSLTAEGGCPIWVP